MLSHILVPLDGSPLAETALEYALELVKPGGKLTLLSVVQVPEYPIYDLYPVPAPITKSIEQGYDELLPGAKTYLERLSARIAETHQIETNILVEMGDPAVMICDTADKVGADVIVMSTHGRSGLNRWFFGSVTSKVLVGTHVPVFVVPNKNRRKTGEHVKAEAAAN